MPAEFYDVFKGYTFFHFLKLLPDPPRGNAARSNCRGHELPSDTSKHKLHNIGLKPDTTINVCPKGDLLLLLCEDVKVRVSCK